MKVEEIKSTYQMRDILARYNIKVVRGFCNCPLHDRDRTASMRVYEDSFYCFGCGAGGDVIRFVQLYEHVSFKEACKLISGEELPAGTSNYLNVTSLKRQREQTKKNKLHEELSECNKSLSGLWQKFLNAKPLSANWCKLYNKWQLLVYKQQTILEELGKG